ncbi:MAG: hypothetical protein ISS93_00995 [Candidatus Aenigmarchaeota archaeon]|nr:hypothetical protein [Candidatus Aenigmarchaeota archaeon]
MISNENLAAIHGYLCSDGYVITNPITQKHKYYYIALRNKNITLLKDFQKKCNIVFGIKPIISKQIDRCKIQNKKLFIRLTSEFGSFYSHEWKMPTMNKKSLRRWMRAYFDCDGWVRVLKAKDRKIGLESVNEGGLKEIQSALLHNFSIKSNINPKKGRKIYAMNICGKDNLALFKNHIGFLHPEKSKKLEDALDSYMDYNWSIPQERGKLLQFILQKGRKRESRNEIRFYSILKKNLLLLNALLQKYNIRSKIFGPWKNNWGSEYFCLIVISDEIDKIRR